MKYLIISEKPSQGVALSEAFNLKEITKQVTVFNRMEKGTKKAIPITSKIKIFEGIYKGNEILIIPLKGHILNLTGRGRTILKFDFEWKKPTKKSVNKLAIYKTIKQEIHNFDCIVIATDLDEEGELIGYNIVSHFDVLPKTKRMIFQSLMESDLQYAFDNLENIRLKIAEKATFRAWGDKVSGYIFSKILTKAYSEVTNAQYMQMSVGRVMTPSLNYILENMESIEKAKNDLKNSKPRILIYFQLLANLLDRKYSANEIKIYESRYDITMKKAIVLRNKYANIKGEIIDIYEEEEEILARHSGLMIDDIREWAKEEGIDYKRTDQILEALYLSKLITYPRSESNTLPTKKTAGISPDYHSKRLLNAIKFLELEKFQNKFIDNKIKVPRMGNEYDGAHWGVHPTEKLPIRNSLSLEFNIIYEYILKTYIKGFCKPKTVKNHKMITDFYFLGKYTSTFWTTIIDFGHEIVDNPSLINFVFTKDPIPDINIGDEIKTYTQITQTIETPDIPERATKRDLFEYMKNNNLGTDATRPSILEKLWDLNMVRGDPIFITILGKRIVEIMRTINPQITKVEMTKDFEDLKSSIELNEISLNQAKKQFENEITKLIKDKLNNLEEIGNKLAFFGECQKCGSPMKLISWRKENTSFFFLACSSEDCSFTAPI